MTTKLQGNLKMKVIKKLMLDKDFDVRLKDKIRDITRSYNEATPDNYCKHAQELLTHIHREVHRAFRLGLANSEVEVKQEQVEEDSNGS